MIEVTIFDFVAGLSLYILGIVVGTLSSLIMVVLFLYTWRGGRDD